MLRGSNDFPRTHRCGCTNDVCVCVCVSSLENSYRGISYKKRKARQAEEIRRQYAVISQFICGDLSLGCVCFYRVPGSLIGEVRAPAAVYRPADVRRPEETLSLDCRRVQVDNGRSAKGPSGLRGSSSYGKKTKEIIGESFFAGWRNT